MPPTSSHKILKIFPFDQALCKELRGELGICEILAQILINRGLRSPEEARRFLDLDTGDLLDPFSFSDMHKAVRLIKKAKENKEKVMVFGDYDADGIAAVALLESTLKQAGAKITHYLPHRIKEGYGLNKNILHLGREKNIKLLITVDCGMANHKEIEELRRNKIEVIVTDHHEPQGTIPLAASCVINPKAPGSSYNFRELAGVGVAYKLAQAVSAEKLFDELDLVSLGTIADSVPLIGENRIIAKEGLLRLAQTERPGLKVLIENAGIRNKKFTATFVSFILGPRINASGRMDSAELSLELLLCQDEEKAKKLAKILESHNRQRQKVENQILEEAEAIINKEVNFKEHKVIVIAKEDWHQGVLGIVASKLADRFLRPSIVISIKEDLCKGSARSIKNFHLFNALIDCKEFLNSFGGHSHAAGLLITKESIADFRESINRLAHQRMSLEDLLPSLDIDLELNLCQLNQEVIEELERLEPFGQGNPEPLFYTRGLRLKGQPQILSRETIKFWVSDGKATFQAIGFGMSSLCDSLKSAETFDLVHSPKIDRWFEKPSVILEIRDIFFR